MRSLFVLFLGLLACRQPETSQSPTKPQAQKINFRQSLLDTLQKYPDADSLYLRDTTDNFYFVGQCNGVRFGLVAHDDTLDFYDAGKKQWNPLIRLDSLPFYNVEYTDINGDRYQDVLLYSIFSIRANTMSKVLLFNPIVKRFQYDPSYNLINIQYVPKGHYIVSYYQQAVGPCHNLEVYRIKPEGLTKFFSASFYPINEKHDGNDSGEVEIKRFDAGKEVFSQTTRGKIDNVYPIFDQAVQQYGSPK